jgi:hypothetical protein
MPIVVDDVLLVIVLERQAELFEDAVKLLGLKVSQKTH